MMGNDEKGETVFFKDAPKFNYWSVGIYNHIGIFDYSQKWLWEQWSVLEG